MQSQNLIRRQYLVSEKNLKKLDSISKKMDCSAAEIVRKAIDAYDINQDKSQDELDTLLDMASQSIQEAIKSTKAANRKVSKTLKSLDERTANGH